MDNSKLDFKPSGTIGAMKIICPVCELWLVEIQITEGQGGFYCARCLDLERRRSSGDVLREEEVASDPLTCCRLCDLGVFSN